MTTPDLIDFIRNQVNGGTNRDNIIKILLGQGWTMLDIEEGFATLAVEHPLTPAANASTATPPNIGGQFASQLAPISSRPDPMTALTRSTQYNAQALQKNTGKNGNVWIMIVAIIVLCALGGLTAYAYFEQIGPFANPPYKSASLASDIFSGFSNIKTSSYSLHMNVAAEPKDADATPFDLSVNDSAQVQAYNQDLDTVRDLQTILESLQSYYALHGAYPYSLPQTTNIPASRLSAYVYSRSSDSSDFSLTAQFQSASAVSEIQQSAKIYSSGTSGSASSVVVSGKSMTFSKISPAYIYMSPEPPQPFLADVLGLQQYLGYVPSDFVLDGTLSGATAKTADGKLDGQVHISGSVDYSSITVSLDAQFKKVGDNMYVLLSKFPSLFGDLSKIENKWITLTPADLASYGSSYLGSSSQSPQDQMNAEKDEAVKAVGIFLSVADKNQALMMTGAPTEETVNGVRAYRYDLEFNKATMPKFYTDLTGQFAAAFKDKNPLAFDQSTLDYLNSSQFSQAFDYFRKNTTLVLWADKNGVPIQVMYKLRMVPSAGSKNSDQQIMLTVTLTLSDINKQVSIDAPETSMSLEDATIAMTGQTKEQYEFTKQESNVQLIRELLSNFKSVVGSYPSSLDALTQNTSGLNGKYAPAVTALPLDVYTGKPYVYARNGSDYTLTYTINLPPYVKGTTPLSGIYTYSFSSSNYGLAKEKIVMAAVNGTNTANSTSQSVETAAQSKIDSDGDGLPDVLENYLGTDPNKTDTDGDGYSDYNELMKGSNPLGPGNLQSTGSSIY